MDLGGMGDMDDQNRGVDPNQQVDPNFMGGNQPPEYNYDQGMDLDDGAPVNANGMFNGNRGAEEEPEDGEEGEADEYFDDAGDIGYLPADHPLMTRLQNALTKQLTDEHERVDLQLREKEEEVRKVKKEREGTGVQLYGVQH